MLKDYRLINERLTSRRILEVLSADDPAAYDSETCNLELEVSFDLLVSLLIYVKPLTMERKLSDCL